MKIPSFDKAYMDHRMHIAWRGPVIAAALIKALNPVDALDLGCATGDYARQLNELGVPTIGVDNSPAAGQCLLPEQFCELDITNQLPFRRDLVILLEVLSILKPDQKFPALEAAMTASTRFLVVNHLPAVLPEFRDFVLDPISTNALRDELEPHRDKQATKALWRTGVVYRRKDHARYPIPQETTCEGEEKGTDTCALHHSILRGRSGDLVYQDAVWPSDRSANDHTENL